jgi:hypothetical protein
MKEVLNAITNGKTELIGEGKWIKDSAYQVHKIEDRYYSVIVSDSQNKWLMDSSIEEIKKEDISKYI